MPEATPDADEGLRHEALSPPPVPTPGNLGLEHRSIIGMRVDATTYPDAIDRVLRWGRDGESRTVGIATVNNVMEAHDDPGFGDVMADCDLVTADGVPLVWSLKLLGVREATRVYGPELTPRLLAAASRADVPVGFYGGTPDVIEALHGVAAERWPELRIAYSYAPPFRALTDAEDDEVVEAIVASGAKLLFIGLGCPKQERWMYDHRGQLPLVQLGVGAAFDFLAGTKRQAPAIMQRVGLEWLFRLASEPRRLWKRYLRHNPRFVALLAAQVVRARFGGHRRSASAANGKDS
ncbi:MAG: WecB/TagA/CpsF family glycosyltransferase [Actinomycetota bacterium]|nr:WecB/TagA/CpsF family glycosyltransferase [Actinomycetota bacterium]